MWVFIMLAMFLVVLGSFFYVTRRISQFRFMEKVSKGRKWLRILESLVPVLAMLGVLWYTMGMMDALICMIHLVIIWLLCDGVTALLHKKTRQTCQMEQTGSCGLFAYCFDGRLSDLWMVPCQSCMGSAIHTAYGETDRNIARRSVCGFSCGNDV